MDITKPAPEAAREPHARTLLRCDAGAAPEDPLPPDAAAWLEPTGHAA